MVTKAEKQGGLNQEFGFKFTLLSIKYTTNKDIEYSTGNCIQYVAISSNGKEPDKNR